MCIFASVCMYVHKHIYKYMHTSLCCSPLSHKDSYHQNKPKKKSRRNQKNIPQHTGHKWWGFKYFGHVYTYPAAAFTNDATDGEFSTIGFTCEFVHM